MGLFPHGLDLPAGIALGLIAALELMVWLDPKGEHMSAPAPNLAAELAQPLADAVSATSSANAAAEGVKQAQKVWASAKADHAAKRNALIAVLDKHLTVTDPSNP
jgi:hypothetical protein